MQALLERRLVFVTGKGGVGKSAVAAALARVAASRGKRVLVCEMDDKGSLATYLGYEQLAFEPVTVAPNLSAMAMNTEDSLREYIKLYLRVPIIGSLAPLARIFDFVANAAPAVKEILAIGKLCYEVREKNYDLIIADSEASGHFVAQVSAPDALAALVRIGIIADQTKWMSDLLHDHAVSAVLAVVTPEEMPVVETLELRERMAKATPVNFAGVVVNRMPVEPAREAVAAVASSATVSDETRAVVQWLAARRAAAEGHAKVLADAFELANVETLSEAPAESGDAEAGHRVPTAIVAHLVGEIDRVLGEHA
ncbi:MAG: anion-transporting ATPase [Actinobacteria bacterium]|nr:anion-transporting ATPase [Actinomycetota bacterium]